MFKNEISLVAFHLLTYVTKQTIRKLKHCCFGKHDAWKKFILERSITEMEFFFHIDPYLSE
jgi:hypothetical protein